MQTFIKVAGTTTVVLSGLVIAAGLFGMIIPVLISGVTALTTGLALLFSPV